MNPQNRVRIGLLSPEGTNSSHFRHFEDLLPPEIELSMEGLELARTSRYELRGKSEVIVARALQFARKLSLQGLIVTGAPVAILNPGLESQVSQAVGIPVVTAVSSAIAALKTIGAKNLLVITPFDVPMNESLTSELERAGLHVLSCPAFADPTFGSSSKVGPEEVFASAAQAFGAAGAADAIYFQGARLDPLPIIDKLERELAVPVIASNPAMLWHILSRLEVRCSIDGYGKLLKNWPALASP
jgi:maleate cis-trans isomerase